MTDPIDRQLLVYLRLLHAAYNLAVMSAFIGQAWLGIKIRKARKTGSVLPLARLRRHRRSGPFLVFLSAAGFISGISIVLLYSPSPLKYVFHLSTGALLISSITATMLISRKITASDERIRNLHFFIGILIICLYVIQLFSGLSILL